MREREGEGGRRRGSEFSEMSQEVVKRVREDDYLFSY